MIQDTSLSPEMYLARRGATQCGGWGLGQDDTDAGNHDDIDLALVRERAVFWAVTVPGESAWCTTHLDRPPSQTNVLHPPPLPHKFPIPGAPHVGVQVKVADIHPQISHFIEIHQIYSNVNTVESLKATELYTFVGILTFEP